MERLVDATAIYLNAQATAGAQALQVFDSWVGTLSPADYRRFVQPHMARLFARLDPSVPVIHFGTDTGSLLELQRDAGGTVIGLDWRVELDAAWRRLGDDVAVQGNLDPTVLLSSPAEIDRPGPADPGRRPAAAPATSSTSGTASSPPPPWTTSGPSSISSTTHRPAGMTRVGWVKPTGTRPRSEEDRATSSTRPPCPFGPRSARISSWSQATLTMH